jgi:hypothetical protein
VLALLLLGGDIVTSLEKSDIVMRGLTQDLGLIDADPTPWLDANLDSTVAGIVETVLSWPGWAVLGVLGLALGALAMGSPRYEDD